MTIQAEKPPVMPETSAKKGVDAMNGCPICQSRSFESLYPAYQGRCITSQLFFVDDIELDNRCCTNCGFIYNQKGIRGREEEVYSREVWKPKPQVVSFSDNVMTTHQRALNVFQKIGTIAERGSLLDFGAGTGAFLQAFSQVYPQWELSAIEPGDGFRSLIESVPLKQAYNEPFYKLKIDERFDMISVMSILEHIADPMDALHWIHRVMKPDGILLMQHPNFSKLPGDLVCADHINKLTPTFTRRLCEGAGFTFISQDASMVSFYQAYGRGDRTDQQIPKLAKENLAIAKEAEHIAQRTIMAVEETVTEAQSKGTCAAVFGTSPIGSMAHLLLGCKDAIACFVDENPHMWGNQIDGIPVVGPDRMMEYGVTDIAIAISPLYWESVSEKMSKIGMKPHVPKI